MERTFLASLPNNEELAELKKELVAVADLDLENRRRLDALSFAVELCIAVSSAAGPHPQDRAINHNLLNLAAEGSNAARFGVTNRGPQGPLRMAEIIDEFRSAAGSL